MKNSQIVPIFLTALATLAIGPGCKTLGKVNALLDEAKETARKAGDVADNVPMLVDNATMAATDAVSQSAAALGGIPAMASRFTGGTDLGRTSEGRKGALTEDVDGDGSAEEILVFVDDSEETFLAFELTYEEEGEQGRDCYTSWDEPDGVWLVITECGDHPEGELVDVCTWSHDGDDLACLGLTCSGDECDLDLCYDEDGEVECVLEDDDDGDDDDDDDDDDDVSDGDDVGDDDDDDDDDNAACDEAATVVEDAYAECDYADPGLDCTQEPEDIAACADGLDASDDACIFLDSDEGYELCPWG